LQSTSPAIDYDQVLVTVSTLPWLPPTTYYLGNTYNTTTLDLANNVRINNTYIDLGAYEYHTVLPVELLSFTATLLENNQVQLDWQTATELNNSHFEIEWSTDGFEFDKIGEVQGAGTTTEVQFYEFLHQNPQVGNNYYRLKQVDFDENYEYTNILNIEYRIMNIEYRIFPNPATNYITVEGIKEGELAQIFNVNGQLVKEFQMQSSSHRLTIDELPSGTYFVKMGEQVKKLIIAK
jgi:hypothetical protein